MVLRTPHSDVSKSSSDSNSSNRDSLYRERKDNRRVLLPTPHSGDVNKSNSNSNSNSSYSASNNSRNRSAVSSNSNNSNSYSASSNKNRSGVSSNVGHNKELAAVPDSRLVHTERSHFGRRPAIRALCPSTFHVRHVKTSA